jgi:hypothetical protein
VEESAPLGDWRVIFVFHGIWKLWPYSNHAQFSCTDLWSVAAYVLQPSTKSGSLFKFVYFHGRTANRPNRTDPSLFKWGVDRLTITS